MPLTYRLKSAVNRLAERYGYHLERIVDYGDHQLNVFHVLIDQLNPGDPGFFFVQAGANDGRTDDPLNRLIRRYHWRGLLLEPLPEVFKRLVETYRDEPQLILENAAVAPQDGTLSLWTDRAHQGLMASFDRSKPATRIEASQLVEIPVQARTFATLLRTHDIHRIDLLQIDTEGFDFEVLKMAMKEGLPRPRLIRYEHLLLSQDDRAAAVELLAAHGYKMFRERSDTLAYRRPEPA